MHKEIVTYEIRDRRSLAVLSDVKNAIARAKVKEQNSLSFASNVRTLMRALSLNKEGNALFSPSRKGVRHRCFTLRSIPRRPFRFVDFIVSYSLPLFQPEIKRENSFLAADMLEILMNISNKPFSSGIKDEFPSRFAREGKKEWESVCVTERNRNFCFFLFLQNIILLAFLNFPITFKIYVSG